MVTNVLDYLAAAAARWPDKPAYVDEHTTLTFAGLDAAVQAVGTGLAGLVGKGEPVAVYMAKSVQQIAAFFGTAAAGAFYVPMDVTMPAPRAALILQTLEAGVLITDAASLPKAEALGFSGRVLLYDELAATPPDTARLAAIRRAAIDADPLYAIFTSGSTGVPKGVVTSMRSAVNFTEWYCTAFAFTEAEVFGNQTPFYFDASVKDIYATLRCGATMVIIPKMLFSFPGRLMRCLNDNRVTCIDWVPSALCLVADYDAFTKVPPLYLKKVMFLGEVMPTRQFNQWRRALPHIQYANLYGPTEATGDCTYYKITRELRDDEPIPIGRACENTEVFILNSQNALAAPGEIGELCVRGVSLALGYYNDPEKTAAAFVPNPLQPHYRELIYRTGDLARVNERGEILICGRLDSQIKHMGHRIELGEIETAIAALPGIRHVCCLYDKAAGKIVAVYEGELDRKAIIDGIKERLPKYMLPNVFHQLEHLPLNLNGKLDRAALKAQYTGAASD